MVGFKLRLHPECALSMAGHPFNNLAIGTSPCPHLLLAVPLSSQVVPGI